MESEAWGFIVSDVERLILRFRDLGIPSGATVERHNAIAEQRGYVWWGWWNKTGEQVPTQTLTALRDKARALGGLPLVLYDSGQNLVYEAMCRDIEWRPDLTRMLSPNQRHTPAYYKKQDLLIWFRLERIKPIESAVLRNLTYVRVDEFFESGESRYGRFYEKRVYSPAELQDQNRTIWFVRAAQPEDQDYLVALLDGSTAPSPNYAPLYAQSHSKDLLWVSDLHFSNKNEHAFPLASVTNGRRMSLSDRLHERLKSRDQKVGGLVITGDLTYRAARDEYGQVSDFLEQVLAWSGLNRDQLLVVPGNHDLTFSKDPSKKHAPVATTLTGAKAAYKAFYAETFRQAPSEFLSMGRRLLLHDIPVEIIGLNSSALQQTRERFQGHGFLGDAQLSEAADEMGWGSEEDRVALRIVALHHHVVPVTFMEEPKIAESYSVVLDAEAFMRWLVKHRVDLVIHGHQHQPGAIRLAKPINLKDPQAGSWEFGVLAMGSSGVVIKETVETHDNTYAHLTVDPTGITVVMHKIHTTIPHDDPIWTLRMPRGRLIHASATPLNH